MNKLKVVSLKNTEATILSSKQLINIGKCFTVSCLVGGATTSLVLSANFLGNNPVLSIDNLNSLFNYILRPSLYATFTIGISNIAIIKPAVSKVKTLFLNFKINQINKQKKIDLEHEQLLEKKAEISEEIMNSVVFKMQLEERISMDEEILKDLRDSKQIINENILNAQMELEQKKEEIERAAERFEEIITETGIKADTRISDISEELTPIEDEELATDEADTESVNSLWDQFENPKSKNNKTEVIAGEYNKDNQTDKEVETIIEVPADVFEAEDFKMSDLGMLEDDELDFDSEEHDTDNDE